MTTNRVTLDELDDDRHRAGQFGWIEVVSPDRTDDCSETVWQQEANISSSDPNERASPMRLLTVVASDSDAVRRRLEELGYANDGFVHDDGR